MATLASLCTKRQSNLTGSNLWLVRVFLVRIDKYFTISPFWACFQDQTVWWLYQQGHGMSQNWSWISWWTVLVLSTSAHWEPAPVVLCRLPTPILAGSVSVDRMWFSCSDYFVSHYSNILWLIAFGCAFPSSLFLLKVHCVCKSLSGSGLWQPGFSEVAQITLWGGAVLSLNPCGWESLPHGLLSPHSPL